MLYFFLSHLDTYIPYCTVGHKLSVLLKFFFGKFYLSLLFFFLFMFYFLLIIFSPQAWTVIFSPPRVYNVKYRPL